MTKEKDYNRFKADLKKNQIQYLEVRSRIVETLTCE